MALQINRQIIDIIAKANSLAIVVGGAPTIDSLGSALALSLALSAQGKRTQVVTQGPIRAEHSRLVGCDRVENQLKSARNYVISLPDAVDTIEKISCYAQDKTLNIVLQPYGDIQNFDPKDIQYAKTDSDLEALILVDVPNRQDISRLLADQAQLASQVPNIAIGRMIDRKLQYVVTQPNSVASAEIMYALLGELRTQLNADVANNLLQAIYDASDDFHTGNVTPELFELSASLLKIIKGEAGMRFSPIAPTQAAATQRPGQTNQQNQLPRNTAPQFPRPPRQPLAPNVPAVQDRMAPNSSGLADLRNQNPVQPGVATGPMMSPRSFEVDPYFEFDTPPDMVAFDDIAASRPGANNNTRDMHAPASQMPQQRESFTSQTAPRANQQRNPQPNRPAMPTGLQNRPTQAETRNPNNNGQTTEKLAQSTQRSNEGQSTTQPVPQPAQAPSNNVPNKDWLKPPKVYSGKTEDLF